MFSIVDGVLQPRRRGMAPGDGVQWQIPPISLCDRLIELDGWSYEVRLNSRSVECTPVVATSGVLIH